MDIRFALNLDGTASPLLHGYVRSVADWRANRPDSTLTLCSRRIPRQVLDSYNTKDLDMCMGCKQVAVTTGWATGGQ